jgi:2-dehydropantoate 2-reductase
MKIIVAGAGGVGGYFGAALSRAGHEVFFIARGAHLDAIGQNGLLVKSAEGDFTVKPPCGPDSSGFGAADLALVCFKAYDTATTTGLYAQSVGPQTAIISLQNGLDNEPALAKAFDPARIVGGVAFIGSRVAAPGMILHTAFGSIAIGELNGLATPRVEALGQMFAAAGIKCRVSSDIIKDKYAKMTWNVGFNGLCAILDCTAGDAVRFNPTRALVRTAMMEWIMVARRSGVSLDYGIVDRNIQVTLAGGEVIPSMLEDKRRGRRMEIESFNGKAERMGMGIGVPTPVNSMIAAAVRFYNSRIGQDATGPR